MMRENEELDKMLLESLAGRDKVLLELLANRYEKKLRWYEACPGLDIDVNTVTANATLTATVHDCINMARHRVAAMTLRGIGDIPLSLSDKELLLYFIVNNWAEVV